MTGKQLVMYILEHDLLDEPVWKNGRLLGFKTESEVAAEMGVGLSTVHILILRGAIPAVEIEGHYYIPAK